MSAELYLQFVTRNGFSGVVRVTRPPEPIESFEDYLAQQVNEARDLQLDHGLVHFSGDPDDIVVVSLHKRERGEESPVQVVEPSEAEGQGLGQDQGQGPPEDLSEAIAQAMSQVLGKPVQVEAVPEEPSAPPQDAPRGAEHEGQPQVRALFPNPEPQEAREDMERRVDEKLEKLDRMTSQMEAFLANVFPGGLPPSMRGE